MIARDIYAEFRTAERSDDGVVLSESDARALVDRAEACDVAVAWVELEPDHARSTRSRRDRLSDLERRGSWGDARAFLDDWSGRELRFHVSLESAFATRLARAKRRAMTLIQDNTTSRGPDRHP